MSDWRDDPRNWVGDFESGEVVDYKTGKKKYIRRIPRHYPGGDVSSNTVLGIIGAVVIAIGVYAYMKGNPPMQPPVG